MSRPGSPIAAQRVEQKKQSPLRHRGSRSSRTSRPGHPSWISSGADARTSRIPFRPASTPVARVDGVDTVMATEMEHLRQPAIGRGRRSSRERGGGGARHEGARRPLHHAVLPAFRGFRGPPAGLHGVGVAHEPQPALRIDPVRRPRQLRGALPRLVLLERGREHARDLGALDGAQLSRARVRVPPEQAAAGAELLPDEPAPDRRSPRSSPSR